MQEQRRSRKDARVNMEELVHLREENKLLKERCQKYTRILETSADPEILRKFFAIEVDRMARAEEEHTASKRLETTSSELVVMREQYEAMKKSQLTLTEMNKKLIDRHSEEVNALHEQLKETREELATKRRKLEKYVVIVRDFGEQMKMFESFQASS